MGPLTVQIFDTQGNLLGSEDFAIPAEAYNGNGQWYHSLDCGPNGHAIEHTQSHNLLARIMSLSCTMLDDPAVGFEFSVVNLGAAPQLIVLTSPSVSFSALTNPDGYATASVTVTDRNLNGASTTGGYAGGLSYQATYNGGTAWATILGGVTAPTGGSKTGDDRRPTLPTLWETIPATVTSIQSQYKFTLSAGDSASGTSYFEVVPEPATLGLMGLGLVALLARRRAR